MSLARRASRFTLTVLGTALVVVGVLAVATWLLVLLDRATSNSGASLRIDLLGLGLAAMALSALARLLYRRWFGVAADVDAWIRQRPPE